MIVEIAKKAVGNIKAGLVLTGLISFLGLVMIGSMLFSSGCQEITDRLHRYLDAAHEYWNFNGSVLIAWKGRIIVDKSYGMANEIIGLPNTSQTKFFIGSITKQFTAAAIMILKEKQLINLDLPVSTYLPDFKNEYADKITVRHLLTHSSGLPNYTEKMEFYLKRMLPFNPDELLKTIQDEALVFEPGTGFLYSNTGYILLGAIIERVSGQSYEAFLHKEIFKPLDMHNTGYGRREAGHPDRADGYTHDESGQLDAAVPIEFSFLHSAGALYSTVEDLLKWDKALSAGRILKPAAIKEMISPRVDHYGYGWYVESRRGYIHTFHDGAIDGFNTIISRWPDVGLCIIVLSNDDVAPVDKMAFGLADICFARETDFPVKKTPYPLDEKYYDNYPGVYKSDDDRYWIIDFNHGELSAGLLNQPKRRLIPQAIDTFFYAIDNTKTLNFHRDENRKIIAIEIIDGENKILSRRLPEQDARKIRIDRTVAKIDADLLNRYIGRYLLEPALSSGGREFDLEVLASDEIIIAKISKTEAIELYPNSQNSFFHKNADWLLTFQIDNQGKVTGCILRIGLSQHIGRKID